VADASFFRGLRNGLLIVAPFWAVVIWLVVR
jgi:hypothetical protein